MLFFFINYRHLNLLHEKGFVTKYRYKNFYGIKNGDINGGTIDKVSRDRPNQNRLERG